MAEKRFASENFPPEIQAMADGMNLDENAVPAWTIPPVASRNAGEFLNRERPELLRKFAKYIYGVIPPKCAQFDVDVVAEDKNAFGGLATRREIVLRCAQNGLARYLNMLLYYPNDGKPKHPVFFGLNFKGNHACTFDEQVRFILPHRYPKLNDSPRYADERADFSQRGLQDDRWCFEKVLKRGYAVATISYWDIYPDHPYGFEDSVLRLFFDETVWNSPQRPTAAISAWAWGVQRAIDALELQPEIDATRIAVHGHSRLGKTALWAGANDTRIALTISCCSGTCGAKLSHRYYGEDFNWINLWNPHWVVPGFLPYIGHDSEIPVDQHQLIGCIAPRLAYITSATEDCYADPKGEFLAGVAASDYYRLFGKEGIGTTEMPAPKVPLHGDIGYYLRVGEHSITPENWDAILDFADKRLLPLH